MTPTRLIARAVLALLVAPGIAFAQSRIIDPDQEVDHFRAFGPWEVMCDVKPAGGERRCYLRLVDVYSPRPDFKAAFVFITAARGPDGKSRFALEFAIEPGFAWMARPLAVRIDAARLAGLPMARCAQPACAIKGDDAAALLDTLRANARAGVDLVLAFREKDGAARELAWPLAGFGDALADFAAARKARDLP